MHTTRRHSYSGESPRLAPSIYLCPVSSDPDATSSPAPSWRSSCWRGGHVPCGPDRPWRARGRRSAGRRADQQASQASGGEGSRVRQGRAGRGSGACGWSCPSRQANAPATGTSWRPPAPH